MVKCFGLGSRASCSAKGSSITKGRGGFVRVLLYQGKFHKGNFLSATFANTNALKTKFPTNSPTPPSLSQILSVL